MSGAASSANGLSGWAGLAGVLEDSCMSFFFLALLLLARCMHVRMRGCDREICRIERVEIERS